MATTTVPAFLDALKTALEARAGLVGVTIATCPLAEEAIESIEFGYRITGTQGWAAMGQRRREDNYVITGIVWIAKDGGGETAQAAAKEARDRVYELFAELEAQLRDTPWLTNIVAGLGAQLTRVDFDQWYDDAKRIARMTFEISVSGRI